MPFVKAGRHLESWKPVRGWEGVFEVSDYANVKRLSASRCFPAGNELKAHQTMNGYWVVRFYVGKKYQTKLIHRLVADAFLGPIQEGMFVHHKNADTMNNTLGNLEIVTPKQNSRRAAESGRIMRGENHTNAKLDDEDVEDIRESSEQGEPQGSIAKRHGIAQSLVSMIVNRIIWKHS